jgi:hypothetical protein
MGNEREGSRLTLVFYRMRAFEQEVSVGAKLWRAFDKTV